MRGELALTVVELMYHIEESCLVGEGVLEITTTLVTNLSGKTEEYTKGEPYKRETE